MTSPWPFSSVALVCHLHCALYGLKQFPRAWYERFQSVVLQIGFCPSLHDFALFVLCIFVGLVFLFLYVDVMIISRSNSSTI